MDTLQSIDLKPRCGSCWKKKKGCDGNYPICGRCEKTNNLCDWPEEAQHRYDSSSSARLSFDVSEMMKQSRDVDNVEVPSSAGRKRKRVPQGERVSRRLIRAPERRSRNGGYEAITGPRCQPGEDESEESEEIEDSPDRPEDDNETISATDVNEEPIPTVEVNDPAAQGVLSGTEIDSINGYHHAFLQAHQNNINAKRSGTAEKQAQAQADLKLFEDQFNQIGKEFGDFWQTAGNTFDSEAYQQFNAVGFRWDDMHETRHNLRRARDRNFKDGQGNTIIPPLPTMNVDGVSPALTQLDWGNAMNEGLRNPLLPPIVFAHEAATQASNYGIKSIATEERGGDFVFQVNKKDDWPTLADIDADALVAGEGHEEPGLDEAGEAFAAIEAANELVSDFRDLDELTPAGELMTEGELEREWALFGPENI